MDQAVLEGYALSFGYKIVSPTWEDHAFAFKAIGQKNSVVEFSVSQYFLDRIGTEFNSMK